MQMSRGFKSHPVRTLPVADRQGRSERQTSLPATTNGPNEKDPSEGWQNGNAPVSKTGVLTDFRVRIPAPPLCTALTYAASRPNRCLKLGEGVPCLGALTPNFGGGEAGGCLASTNLVLALTPRRLSASHFVG